jgi:hypothetical protein
MKARKQEGKLTEAIKCGHCGNVSPMKIGAHYSCVKEYFDEESDIFWKEGSVYYILECPTCDKISVTTYYCDERFPEDWEESHQLLYPIDDQIPVGLPPTIKVAYEAALKVRPIDPNAYGVLVGRVLEMVCVDRNARATDLNSRLEDLAAKGEIASKLVGVVNGLRNLRNVGAHAFLGDLTADEGPILTNLVKAVLEYVYSAPHLAQVAQEKFNSLKSNRQKS